MADNNSTSKSPKNIDKTKLSISTGHHNQNEALRLTEVEQAISNATVLSNSNQRKKPCSFQITSVVVGRGNNDGGDDSADDLDESHADDISDVIENSRITDNETPSYSEDTCSKDEIFYNVSNSSLCSAPVIPTSSQYGLAIVSPSGNPIMNNPGSSDNPIIDVNVTIANPTSVDHVNLNHDHKDMQVGATSRNDRFKVVKIESTEPFRRGRWSCMDFLDSANQPFGQLQQVVKLESGVSVVGANITSEMTDYRTESSGPSTNIPASSSYQQSSQSMPVQQLAQNLNQSNNNQMTQMSQSQYYTSNPVQGQNSQQTQYNQQNNVQQQYNVQQNNNHSQSQPVPNISGQSGPATSMAGTYSVSQPTTASVPLGNAQGQSLVQNVQSQTQNTSSGQVTYSQPTSSFPPTSSSSQFSTQSQTFSNQSSQQQQQKQPQSQQIVGQFFNSQVGSSNVTAQSQSFSGNQVQQNVQGQSYSGQSTQQIVNSNLPTQGQSFAGQISRTGTTNVPTQAQSYVLPPNDNTAVSAQGQSFSGQVGSTVAQGQSYSQSPLSTNIVGSSNQTFTNQQTQTTYAQTVVQSTQNQTYVQQTQQQPSSNVQSQQQNQQTFHSSQAQGQSYSSSQSQSQPQQQPQSQLQTQTPPQPEQTQQQPQPEQPPPSQQQPQPQSQSQQQQQQPPPQSQQPSQPQSQQQQPIQPQSQSQSQPPPQSQPQQSQTQPQQPQSQQFISGSVGGSTQHQSPQSQPQQTQSQSQPQQQQQQQQPQSQTQSQQYISGTSQSQNFVVSMPSSPASVPQQPIYPSSSQKTTSELTSSYKQQPNYVSTMASSGVIGSIGSIGTSFSGSLGAYGPQITQLVNVQPNNYRQAVTQATSSSVYTNSQFKAKSTSTVSNEGSSPSEPPAPAVPLEPTGDSNATDETQTVLDDTDSFSDLVMALAMFGGGKLSSLEEPVSLNNRTSVSPIQTDDVCQSAAGNSAVAIDNKIEQAMDLVKSHLMFAVREEVEVLKEKIAELMDRINQLETENSILKAAATQETLAQLSSPASAVHPQPPSAQNISPSTTTGSST